MNRLRESNSEQLLIILLSILGTFIFSRTLIYFILIRETLPKFLFLNLSDFRLHHFVYGNIIIVLTSFLAIGLGVNKHKNLFALFYGIGLGLVLDEFLLWIGDVNQLTSNVMWIPYSLTAVAAVCVFIATLIMIRLYKLKKKLKQALK